MTTAGVRASFCATERERYARFRSARREVLRGDLARLPLGGARDLVLEFGCGHGHFLIAYAAAFPESMCVGVDIRRERIRRAWGKQRRLALSNVHFLRADANEFLDALPSGVRATDVFVLFPDPWPKRRHRKYRLLSESFFDRLAEAVRPGGRVFFRTDSNDYFEETVRRICAADRWHLNGNPDWYFDHVTVFQEKARFHRSLCAIRLG